MMVQTFEPQQETLSLERAHKAVGYIEQLEYIVKSLTSLSELVGAEYRGELKAVATRAEALYQALNETEEGASLIENGRQLSTMSMSKIERLKLGSEIVRMRNNGQNYKDIGTYLDIDPSSVSKFCKAYDASTPAEKAELKKSSIFDIANNIEEMGAMLYRQLARLENADPEHHVKYAAELRQTIALADKFLEKNTARQKMDTLGQLVLEILIDELPEKRAQVIKRFAAVGFRGALPVS